MSKLLLLVQNESDVTHLDAAAKSILASAITGVWVVFSPAVTVNASEAAAKLDTEIETLKAAERQAADRTDYAAAGGYKTQREGKELDRAQALRDAWKTAPAEARQAKTKSIFGPFLAQLQPQGINVKVSGHSDHYDRDQWVAMLNSLSGVWFKEFTAGGFVVGWPEAIPTAAITPAVPPAVGKAAEVVAQEQIYDKAVKATRREELEAMHHMSLRPIMKALGLDPEGKGKEKMVAEILDRESKPAVAPTPELAEY